MCPASTTLAECERPLIRLTCDKCGRKMQYRKLTLITKHGPNVTMTDLLGMIAKCPKWKPVGGGCGVRYDLKEE